MSLEELLDLEVVTVTAASKQPERVLETPATTLVVTKQDIRLRGYRFLKDVLRDLPGMETTEYYFSEIGTNVPVRGISGNNKIVVLVNGMRVNPPGGEFFPFRSDFSVLGAEQVEVVYGPGSTLYGQDAISAVINVKTRQPTPGKVGEIAIDGGLHHERDGWLWLGHTFGREKNIKLYGYVHYHDSDLSRIDDDYPDWWTPFDRVSRQATPAGLGGKPDRQDFGLNALGRLEVENFSLQVWHRQSERSSAEGYTTGNVAPGTFPGLGFHGDARWGDTSTVIEGRYTARLSDKLTLDSAAVYNRYEINPHTKYIFPVFPSPGVTEWFLNDFKYGVGSSISLEETLRWQITPELSLLAGAYIGSFDIIPKSTIPGGADTGQDTVSQGGQFVYLDPVSGEPVGINRVTRTKYETYAAYAEAGWQVLPDLKLIGGARVTWDSRIYEEDIPITPRASVIYNITDSLAVKYIYTQAFVAPAPYFDATYDRGDILAQPNGNLNPEKATSNEVNLTYITKNLSLGISGYYNEQTDLILVSDRAAPENIVIDQVTLPDGTTRSIVESTNGGESRAWGFDVYGRGRFGDFSPWASYSYVDFEQTVAGTTTTLPGISQHNGRVGVTWAVTPKLYITPSLVIRSTPQNVVPGTLKSELDIPYEVNLHVLYQSTDNLSFYLDLRNVTNHKYALGNFIGGAQPQEGIHGVLGLRIEF